LPWLVDWLYGFTTVGLQILLPSLPINGLGLFPAVNFHLQSHSITSGLSGIIQQGPGPKFLPGVFDF
jgi:hypothetical protein